MPATLQQVEKYSENQKQGNDRFELKSDKFNQTLILSCNKFIELDDSKLRIEFDEVITLNNKRTLEKITGLFEMSIILYNSMGEKVMTRVYNKTKIDRVLFPLNLNNGNNESLKVIVMLSYTKILDVYPEQE
jgi:hypothetical protein